MNAITMKLRRLYSPVLNPLRDFFNSMGTHQEVFDVATYRHMLVEVMPKIMPFNFELLRDKTLNYVSQMKVGNDVFSYKYSKSTSSPLLYASVYACLIHFLYRQLDSLSSREKRLWTSYFDSFQSSDDGLFRDPVLVNEAFETHDCWGARHLAAHVITAYCALDGRPRYPFRFLERYYPRSSMYAWLDQHNWQGYFQDSNDIDNMIMNIGVLLQYQRDFWDDDKAGEAVVNLQEYLLKKIDPETGFWGRFDLSNPMELSRMTQFTYHLVPLFTYDGIKLKHAKKAIDNTLKTQNLLGGFGVKLNSSACEDMDSIFILIQLGQALGHGSSDIFQSLSKAIVWVVANQNEDGGFVFRRNESFYYGHKEMSCKSNESAMFPTWFRTLALAYLANSLRLPHSYQFIRCPGY